MAAKPCILVAVDFSDASKQAVEAAAALAADMDARVVLVHALHPASRHRRSFGSDPIGLLEEEINKDQAMKFHKEFAQPLRARGIDVETDVREGKAVDVVLKAADDAGAALLVLGCQGWGRLEALRIGSVSRRVAERSKVPVVLVPARSD